MLANQSQPARQVRLKREKTAAKRWKSTAPIDDEGRFLLTAKRLTDSQVFAKLNLNNHPEISGLF